MFDKYQLSEEKHQKVFKKICTKLFARKTPTLNPEIFILGGQPGAGKSVLTREVQRSFKDSNIVTINSDEFRLFHPQAQEIFKYHDKEFSAYTDPDTRAWGSEVFEAAIKGHYNIIFEGTMRTTQICHTIKNLLNENYKVNILAMAVPAIKSRISIYSRYQEQLDLYPIARFTSRFSHDAAYYGMLDTLKMIENEHLYHSVTICNRSGNVLFKTGDIDIISAVNQERNRPLDAQDRNNLISDCNILIDKMLTRGEKQEYIEDISGLRQVLTGEGMQNMAITLDNLRNQVLEMKTPLEKISGQPSKTSINQEIPLKHSVFEK